VSQKSQILVIEDNPLNMELICDLLRADGWSVAEAENAYSGLEALNTIRPDLILMDIMLPGMSGIEATHKIKSQQDTRDIPIIAVTASPISRDNKDWATCEFADIVSKPFTIADVRRAVHSVLCG